MKHNLQRIPLPLLCALLSLNTPAHAQETGKRAALEEVIVTARRREESLQETPVAVSAMGEQALRDAGIASITDLQQSVPGLQFGESGSKTPAIFIRGIGQREGSAVLDPGVGVYLNDIFIARQDGQLLDTVDTQSIQVLRGPQGTLFGKNNTGGALLVTTKQPHFEEREFSLGGRLGNNGRRDLKLSGNLPIVEDRVGFRFALNSKKYDGYLKNASGGHTFGDEDRLAATGRLLWEVSESLSVDGFIYWSKQNELSTGLSCLHQNPTSNLTQLIYPGRPDGFLNACNDSEARVDDRENSVNGDRSRVQITSTIYALTLNWSLENFDVKSITGFSQQFDIVRNDDQDATSIAIIDNGTLAINDALRADNKPELDEKRFQISQEIQISGSAFDERLSYTTGLFLSLEEIEDNPFSQAIGPKALAGIPLEVICAGAAAQAGPLAAACLVGGSSQVFPLVTFFATSSTLENKSYAAFAQGTYEVNDVLQLTLGGRYTVEDRERNLTTYDIDHTIYQPRLQQATASATVFIEDVGFYSPITEAQLQLAGDNLPDLPLIVNPSKDVRSQKVERFTPTLTASLLANDAIRERWQLDSGMVYFTLSQGFKAGGFEPRGDELIAFEPEDVTNIELGMKLDALDSRLRFNAAIYTLDYTEIHVRVAEQGEAISDIFLFISNAGEATINGAEIETTLLLDKWLINASANYTDASYDEFNGQVVDPASGTTTTVDRSAEEFALVPDSSFSLAVQYNGMTPFGAVIPRLSVYSRSEIFTGIDERAIEFDSSTLDSLTLWNARLTWLPSETLQLTAFVNNLTDEEYFKSGFTVSAALGAATLVQGEERTFGLEFNWEFR